MRLIKFLSITFLLSFLIIGTMVGCDGDNGDGDNGELAGETECADLMDNDDDGEVDCEDIDCILAPNCVEVTCDDFIEAGCNRLVECDGVTLEDCIDIIELIIDVNENIDCNDVTGLPTVSECIAEIDNFDCEDFNNDLGPDSCSPSEGLCEICEVDEDCAEGLICVDCVDNCTGVDMRCTSAFFDQICEDGQFGFLPAL